MEYEKKYNDLIARINEAKEKPSLCMKDKHHYNGYVETGIRDALDYIVSPENEDEDEKIRKELLEVIRHCYEDGGYALCTDDYKKYSAYLEKQKEQTGKKWIYEDDYKAQLDAEYKQGLEDGRKEQKPAEWSKEDERIKDNLLSELFNLYVGAQIKESTYSKYKEFIKNSIPKIKQLTIEQKSAISRAMFLAKSAGEESLARALNTIYNETNVAQPHWKPSEEQMEALWNLMHYAVNLSSWDKLERQIESLYSDLKQL